MKRITLQDVSKKANVSLNTAAKVLAGMTQQARISRKTANYVQKTARELGYVPNLFARNLRAPKTRTIGVFISDTTDSVVNELSHLILEQLHKRNFFPIITMAESGIDLCRNIWLQNRIQGLILCGTCREMDFDFFKQLDDNSIESVVVGCAYQYPGKNHNMAPQVSYVSVNNFAGIELALNHLHEQGRSKIAYLPGPGWHTDNSQRLDAYSTLIKKYHAPIIASCDSDAVFWKRGYLMAKSLLQKVPDVDSICAYDDQLAIGATKYLAELSIRVPDDISVVGFDNSPQSEYSIPSLTSIVQPTRTMAEKCVVILQDNLEKHGPAQSIQIMPCIEIRESTTKRKTSAM